MNQNPNLSLIIAVSTNHVIGIDGDLPWRLSADLKRFKQLTMGHHLIMGRKTYDSIGRLLPGRTTVIVTRNPDYQVDGAMICHSLDEAISTVGDNGAFVIGGAEIFKQALPIARKLYLTRVLAEVKGDCFLDPIDFSCWNNLSKEPVPADQKNDFESSFEVYERQSQPSA